MLLSPRSIINSVKHMLQNSVSAIKRCSIIVSPALWFVVTSPDLESLVTQGKDEKDAIKNAYEAIELILEEKGKPEQIKTF